MAYVLFVGDEPSKKNTHPSVPFAGAACHKRLVKWLSFLQPKYYHCINSNTEEQLEAAASLEASGFRVVALGNKASERLCRIPHIVLPHPSPKNRALNDSEAESDALKEAYYYIHDNYPWRRYANKKS